MNTTTGVLSGTPKKGGVFYFSVQSVDADNTVVNKDYKIVIKR
jgi:hypothetical protein